MTYAYPELTELMHQSSRRDSRLAYLAAVAVVLVHLACLVL
jgi:hypothetical protein